MRKYILSLVMSIVLAFIVSVVGMPPDQEALQRIQLAAPEWIYPKASELGQIAAGNQAHYTVVLQTKDKFDDVLRFYEGRFAKLRGREVDKKEIRLHGHARSLPNGLHESGTQVPDSAELHLGKRLV